MFSILKKWRPSTLRQKWRDLNLRLQYLENRLRTTDHILDLLVADEVFQSDATTGMNGQTGRKAIVCDLFQRIRFSAAVETGTYMGQTTGFLASSFPIPVHSCEIMPRFHHVARRLLRNLPNARLHCRDARAFLDDLPRELDRGAGPVFFYLDAHWYDDLPLAEEVTLIASRWTDFVALIDDFQVPGDPGYGFDQYGSRALNLDLLAPSLATSEIQAFFPAMPSSHESGRKRGCVLLASPSLVGAVRNCSLLRPHVD